MKKKFYILMCVMIFLFKTYSFDSYASEINDIKVQKETTSNEVESSSNQVGASDDLESLEGQNKTNSDNINIKSLEETSLNIDNKNIYLGMNKSYSEGYIPVIENDSVIIVLPLISEGSIRDNVIITELNLGDGSSVPFIYKNYQKNVNLENNKVNNGTKEVSSYLVSYTLELKSDRINGSYPVVIKTSFNDDNGVRKEQEFTVFVSISDGKKTDEEKNLEELNEVPEFAPKVLVKSTKCDKNEVKAGDCVAVEITLENTSKEKSVKNMTVNVTTDDKNISLANASESMYVDKIGAGETFAVTYKYNINPATPQGEYFLNVNMDYADTDGATYSSSQKASINITQESKISFDEFNINSEVELGDTIMADVLAMNIGRTTIYNVRAEIKADGLLPKSTIFIGNIDAGSSMTGSTSISIVGLSGKSSFGETTGTIIYYYEDNMGNEYSQTQEFKTSIKSPVVDVRPEKNKNDKGKRQWWIIMAVITELIIIAGVYSISTFITKKKNNS